LSVATLTGQTNGRTGWGAVLLGYGDLPRGGVGMFIAMFTVATLGPRSIAARMFATTLGIIALAYLTTADGIVWSPNRRW
jgi:hypothetical protein